MRQWALSWVLIYGTLSHPDLLGRVSSLIQALAQLLAGPPQIIELFELKKRKLKEGEEGKAGGYFEWYTPVSAPRITPLNPPPKEN